MINDKDMAKLVESIRDAADELQREIENLEANIEEKDEYIHELEEGVQGLNIEIADQASQIQELEDALAEAHLTGES